MKVVHRPARSISRACIRMIGIVAVVAPLVLPVAAPAQEDAPAKPRTPRMTCGKCDDGYVTTGRTTDANTCKEDDHLLVSCLPAGSQAQMSVCGSCPEGYLEMGRSQVPALCGSVDGGLRTQCQVPKMEGGMPDPTQGGRKCPPDCGQAATGAAPEDLSRPGKVPSAPDNK